MATAVFLIKDAHWNPAMIHLVEEDNVLGGCLDGGGSNESGFLVRGGRMFDEHYNCTYHFLKYVPSLELPGAAENKNENRLTCAKGRHVSTIIQCTIKKFCGIASLD